MEKENKIFVAGSRGMVGSAIVRNLKKQGYNNIITSARLELDLRDQAAVQQYFSDKKPTHVFLAAAKVGGILANNTYRADFLYENLMIESNVIHAAYLNKVEKLLFLGSSCIYPKMAPQPLKEEYLLTGELEPTNEPYAIAKIAGIKLCESYRDQYGCNFISAMPTNLYGEGDNYHPKNSHVIPGLIRRFHEAKQNELAQVEIWGTGSPLREFMYVDDLADACVFLMNEYNEREFINVGTGEEVSILQLAHLISSTVGFEGEIVFNSNMPDGTPRKIMDSTRLHAMGWHHHTDLQYGLKRAYESFTVHESTVN